MRDKNDLTIVQNFSSDEFTKSILELVKNKIEQFNELHETKKEENYLTRKKTAQLLHISLTCLNDWCKSGILIPLKLGNRTYFKLSDIEKKLNESNKSTT
jgi:hypothetical protein